MGYTSQQASLLQIMIAYLQNADNWPDGNPKVTDFTPGSVAYTVLAAVAAGEDVIGKQYYDAVLQADILTATGTNLDNRVANWGVTRKPAIAANKAFNFNKIVPATNTLTIPAGTLITTMPAADGSTIQFTTDQAGMLTVGQNTVAISATCKVPGPGIAGNLAANTPLLIGSALPGIDSVTLSDAITNGIDKESDNALRARCLSVIQNPQGGGTQADYKNWALSVTGVKTAHVLPLNRGPGTIDIVITGPGGVPDAALIAAVQAEIDSRKPLNVDVLVIPPDAVTINSTIIITLEPGFTIEGVMPSIDTAVANYIYSVPTGGTVYNTSMAAAIISIQGILDCAITLSVSGVTNTNIVLGSEQIAISGTISVS